MPAFKLEMDDRELKSAYVLMAHDTSHDFFQPKETFRKVMYGRGRLEGGADYDMDEDLSLEDPSPPGMIPENDDMDEDLSPSATGAIPEEDTDEVIHEYIGDEGEIDDEVKWWSIDDDMVPESEGDLGKAFENIENSIDEIKEFNIHIDELSDIYDYILISKMKNEAEEALKVDSQEPEQLDLVVEGTSSEGAKADMEPVTPAGQTGDKWRGAMRSSRSRKPGLDVQDKWAKLKEDYKPIMERIVSWDNIVFKLTLEEPPAEVGTLNLGEIADIRAENGPRAAKYNKNRLYTFFEWYNVKKKRATPVPS